MCVYKTDITEINFVRSLGVTIKFVLLDVGGEGISLCARVSKDQVKSCHKCGWYLKTI